MIYPLCETRSVRRILQVPPGLCRGQPGGIHVVRNLSEFFRRSSLATCVCLRRPTQTSLAEAPSGIWRGGRAEVADEQPLPPVRSRLVRHQVWCAEGERLWLEWWFWLFGSSVLLSSGGPLVQVRDDRGKFWFVSLQNLSAYPFIWLIPWRVVGGRCCHKQQREAGEEPGCDQTRIGFRSPQEPITGLPVDARADALQGTHLLLAWVHAHCMCLCMCVRIRR